MNPTLRKLYEERAQVWGRVQELRDADPRDDDALSAAIDDLEAANKAIRNAESLAVLDSRMAEVSERAPETRDGNGHGAVSLNALAAPGEARYGHALSRELRLADLPGPFAYRPAPGDAGRFVRGMVTGNWRGASDSLIEFRTLAEGTGGAGGFLVPTPLATEILDRARNIARVFEAGARTYPMESDTLKVAKVATDPAPAWRNEVGVIVQSEPTFQQVTFDAKSLAVLVRVSVELLEDAPGVESLLEQVLAKAIALELDRVVLMGSGAAPEPQGIFNAAGVTKTAAGANGATPTWDMVIDAVSRVQGKNYVPGALIANSRTFTGLAKVKSADGDYMDPPAYVRDLPRLDTGQVPTNQTQGTATNASTLFAGQWDQVGVGLRTDFRLIPLRERYMDTGEIGFVAWLRGDVQVLRGDAFELLTGILPV